MPQALLRICNKFAEKIKNKRSGITCLILKRLYLNLTDPVASISNAWDPSTGCLWSDIWPPHIPGIYLWNKSQCVNSIFCQIIPKECGRELSWKSTHVTHGAATASHSSSQQFRSTFSISTSIPSPLNLTELQDLCFLLLNHKSNVTNAGSV